MDALFPRSLHAFAIDRRGDILVPHTAGRVPQSEMAVNGHWHETATVTREGDSHVLVKEILALRAYC